MMMLTRESARQRFLSHYGYRHITLIELWHLVRWSSLTRLLAFLIGSLPADNSRNRCGVGWRVVGEIARGGGVSNKTG